MKLILTALCLVLSAFASGTAPLERPHCNLAALTPADRARDREIIPTLAAALLERKELPDGYAYRFDQRVMTSLGEWVAIVAKCCQPLSYEIALEPQPGGALWVRITGPQGAKEFVATEFAPLMEKLAAKGAAR